MPCSNCHCSSCLALLASHISPAESPPPPSELTTTNRAPRNSEVTHCRDVIHSSETAVTMIQATINDLEIRKAELLSLISAHKAAISPLRSFPPEILAEIFGQFIAVMNADARSKNSPPLMLMGICSRWRRIIVDTPRLWTKILTAHPMIDSWITRSKQLPLQLSLNLSPSNSHPVLDALIPHSHRWEHVDFHLGQGSIPILARAKARLHSLKSLNLSFGSTSGTVDFCEVAPRLTRIGLTRFYQPVVMKLPWEQIRVCTLDISELAHYVLQHAENLHALHLDMSKRSPYPNPTFAMPIASHSSHLGLNALFIEWSFMDEDPINSFLSSLTLPALRTLRIHFSFLDLDDPHDIADLDAERAELAPILAAFFERSCTHLDTLELIKIPFSQSDLIKCLAFAPSLISVDIAFDGRWYAIDDKLLHRLDINHPGFILPCLRSLALRGSVAKFIEQPLDAVVASRRHFNRQHLGVALLENLTLDCPFTQLNELPQFHQFVSEGLDITYGEGFRLTVLMVEDPSSDSMS